MADAVSAALRPGDRIYRYGGEEFLVLLERVSASTAMAISERARTAVADVRIPARPLDSDRVVTVSIGVAVGRPDTQPMESIIAAADEALYDAKARGRDRVVLGAVDRKRRVVARRPPPRADRERASPDPREGPGPPATDPV